MHGKPLDASAMALMRRGGANLCTCCVHGSVLDVGLSGVFEAALKIAFNKWCHKLLGKLLMCIHTHSWRMARMLLCVCACERERKEEHMCE